MRNQERSYKSLAHESLTYENLSYENKRRMIFARQKARQRREARLRFALSILGVLAIFAITIGALSVKGKAQSENGQKYKYYTSVQLEYGDTLWAVADRYMDSEFYNHVSYIEEVKSINHIHDEDDVKAGKMLIIPYYSTDYIAD